MTAKQVRQAKIRELLERDHIDTHEKLATALAGEAIEVSQPTLSKDLRELGIVRVPRPDGGFRYAVAGAGATSRERRSIQLIGRTWFRCMVLNRSSRIAICERRHVRGSTPVCQC